MAMNPEKLEALEEALHRAGKRLATQVKGLWNTPFEERGLDDAECAELITKAIDGGFNENSGVRLGEIYDLAAGSYFTIRKVDEHVYRPMLATSLDDPMLMDLLPSVARVVFASLTKRGVEKDAAASFVAASLDMAIEETADMLATGDSKSRKRGRRKVTVEDPEEMTPPSVSSAMQNTDDTDTDESEG